MILEFFFFKQLLAILESHCTETALLKANNDLLMNADAGLCSLMVLLDLSAAFDTIDHRVLLNRLQHWVGIFFLFIQQENLCLH